MNKLISMIWYVLLWWLEDIFTHLNGFCDICFHNSDFVENHKWLSICEWADFHDLISHGLMSRRHHAAEWFLWHVFSQLRFCSKPRLYINCRLVFNINETAWYIWYLNCKLYHLCILDVCYSSNAWIYTWRHGFSIHWRLLTS